MPRILHVSCSPRGVAAFSRRVSEEIVARPCARHPDACVTLRDLGAAPPVPIDAAFSAAILDGAGDDDPALAASEALIAELSAADMVVIGTPMHNYGVPVVLKAWVDQVVRIRRSFASTPGGKVGLLADRPCFLVVASGGWFTGPSPSGAAPQPDFVVPYLRAVLATIGIHDLRVVTLEGVTRGADQAAAALAQARATIAAWLS